LEEESRTEAELAGGVLSVGFLGTGAVAAGTLGGADEDSVRAESPDVDPGPELTPVAAAAQPEDMGDPGPDGTGPWDLSAGTLLLGRPADSGDAAQDADPGEPGLITWRRARAAETQLPAQEPRQRLRASAAVADDPVPDRSWEPAPDGEDANQAPRGAASLLVQERAVWGAGLEDGQGAL
jgi:hypothetical protein